jgi:hypothetical protein
MLDYKQHQNSMRDKSSFKNAQSFVFAKKVRVCARRRVADVCDLVPVMRVYLCVAGATVAQFMVTPALLRTEATVRVTLVAYFVLFFPRAQEVSGAQQKASQPQTGKKAKKRLEREAAEKAAVVQAAGAAEAGSAAAAAAAATTTTTTTTATAAAAVVAPAPEAAPAAPASAPAPQTVAAAE